MTEEDIDKRAREALRDGAEIIARDGWHQGWFHAPGDPRTAPVCAVGSLQRAMWGTAQVARMPVGVETDDIEAYHQAQDVLQASLGGGSVPKWNDDPQRTAEDVILAMKRAAAGE